MFNKKRFITIWLLTCITLVFLIIILGGYTRLTHSGLSIVEWKPISGTIPPIGEEAWNQEFALYKQSPEYKKVNFGMHLQEFKQIFIVEYLHRLLGRITGLCFILPFIFLLTKKILTSKEIVFFSLLCSLIMIQGAIGWFMVKSGLISQPSVSQYRLALHLAMATIIISLVTWQITPGTSRKSIYSYISFFLLMLQIISGAFVAGLRAGLVYNSFPLMDNALIPEHLFIVSPWYLNIFENITMVQFTHRALGILNLINILAYSYKIFNLNELKKVAVCLAGFVIIQFILGITTLILQVPMLLALLHQAVAIILLITITISLKDLKGTR